MPSCAELVGTDWSVAPPTNGDPRLAAYFMMLTRDSWDSWLLVGSFFVLLGLVGLAIREFGMSRKENTKLIGLRYIMTTVIGTLIWWAVGFGFAFGVKENRSLNPFVGNTDFFLHTKDMLWRWDEPERMISLRETTSPAYSYAFFVFTLACMLLSSSIATLGLIDRASFNSYLMHTVVYAGIVYPIVAHWVWAPNGWASATGSAWRIPKERYSELIGEGAFDVAGGIVVHLVAGFYGLVGTKIIGPRKGRFTGEMDTQTRYGRYDGHNRGLASCGHFIFIIALLALSAVSNGTGGNWTNGGRGTDAGRGVLNALLSSAASVLVVFWVPRFWAQGGTPDSSMLHGGLIAGIVSVSCAGGLIDDWAALIAGIVGAALYYFWFNVLRYFDIDDPLDGFAAHGGVGMWAVIVPGLFARQVSACRVYGNTINQWGAVFQGGAGVLGANLVCGAIVIVFTLACAFGCWTLVKHSVQQQQLRMGGAHTLAQPSQQLAGGGTASAGASAANLRPSQLQQGGGGGGFAGY